MVHHRLDYIKASTYSVRCAINGHLAWTTQNASGNRGDDVRALKIAELQPYTMKHPDGKTDIFSVLAMQGEEKAGLKGMKTVGFLVLNRWCCG